MTDTERDKLFEYETLLNGLLSGLMDPKSFQIRFLTAFREDPNLWTGEPYTVLETLFEEVDAYEPDPSIRDKDTIDEVQLRKAVEFAALKVGTMIR